MALKKITGLLFIVSIVFIIIQSCKHDEYFADVCFDTQVLPIFVSHCATSGCHDTITSARHVKLNNYTNIMKGISAGKPNKSRYFNSLKGNGGRIMPPNGSLTNEQIGYISSWIYQGAKETICATQPSGCDSTNITYTNTMQSFFNSICAASGCHDGTNSVGNFNTYANAYAFYQYDGMVIYNHVTGATPHHSVVLSTCQKAQLKKWIQSGAPD